MQDLLVTPHIDRLLQQRANGGRSRAETAGVGGGGGSTSSTAHSEGGGYETRLMQLERQLSQLLQKNKVSCALVRRELSQFALLHTDRLLGRELPVAGNHTLLVSQISHDMSCDAY